MNNRNMMTSLLAIGAAGAAVYGITKGMQNGTLQKVPQAVSKSLNNQNVQQITESVQNMMDTSQNNNQALTNVIQEGANALQQAENSNQNSQ